MNLYMVIECGAGHRFLLPEADLREAGMDVTVKNCAGKKCPRSDCTRLVVGAISFHGRVGIDSYGTLFCPPPTPEATTAVSQDSGEVSIVAVLEKLR